MISLYVQYSSNNKKPIIAAKLKRGKKRELNIIMKECVQDLYTHRNESSNTKVRKMKN